MGSQHIGLLSTLRKFPFDEIKIDRGFVSDLSAANVDALAAVRSIAQLGVSLGMSTTAEGVETKEQLDQVRAEGCTEMQGNCMSRPKLAAKNARDSSSRPSARAQVLLSYSSATDGLLVGNLIARANASRSSESPHQRRQSSTAMK